MIVPKTDAEWQDFAVDVQRKLERLTSGNLDLNGRRVTGAGNSVSAFDYITRYELDQLQKVSTQPASKDTALSSTADVRVGTYATRGVASAHANTIFAASDRDYISFISNGATWSFHAGVHRDLFANRPTPTSDETNYSYFCTNTFQKFYWDGSAWVEEIAPAILKFLGITSSHPAWSRNGNKFSAILADASANTAVEVLDDAYDSTSWDGSIEVPTKNAVRDKIESLLGSSAYTITNVTTDRAYDANATTVDELADVLGTLIADLKTKGILT
jgi:hypothetical protein